MIGWANALRRRPREIRYILIAQGSRGPQIATTFRHAERIVAEGAHPVWLIDMVPEKMYRLTDPNRFLAEWKKHYHDPGWCWSEDGGNSRGSECS